MKVLGSLLVLVFCLFLGPAVPNVTARDAWISLHTRNYHLVGNVNEGEIRAIAVQLERFRDIFTKQFESAALNSPVPTTVIVFRNDSSFGPYKPLFRGRPVSAAGYFQSGVDMNYITISAGHQPYNPYEMIFHESVHLLVDNKLRASPAWFNEGLAEYYSALDFLPEKTKGDKRVAFGKPILRHIIKLRENKLLPLETLFSVDRTSPYYNERDKSSMFYAESWALIHYLTHANSGQRRPQLARFLELLTSRTPVADSFKQAFGNDFATLEKELKAYAQQDRYRATVVPFVEPDASAVESKIVPLTEAHALAHLGDLLLHTSRVDEAEKHLRKALALMPDLSLANASLGVLEVRRGNIAAAKEYLQRAVKSDPQNHLAQYYYADALSREAMDEAQNVTRYSPEAAEQMRAALTKAIEVSPTFPEPYRLLAFVNLVTNTQLDESVALLEKALALSPGRIEFSYVLAQVQLRRKDYKTARVILEQVIEGSPNSQMRLQAEGMLDRVALGEKNQPKQ